MYQHRYDRALRAAPERVDAGHGYHICKESTEQSWAHAIDEADYRAASST